jgi:putative hemolysin
MEKERELVDRIFRLADQRVSALMVPRTEIVWIEADAPLERVRVAVAAESHSHFPVCNKGLDNLLGVVHLKDLVKGGILNPGAPIDLKVLARKPLFVPESMPAIKLLEEFRAGETHIAFVLDEYGVLAGLITLNDIVESLIGHVSRGGEEADPLAVKRADGSWLLDGALPVAELKALMDIERLSHEERTTFNTLAGWVMTHLGRVPRTGDVFSWRGFQFEIIDMDRHRIDKVMLSPAKPKADGERLLSEPAE